MITRLISITFITVLTASCSQQMSFKTIKEFKSNLSLGQGLITINQGDIYTNNQSVTLDLRVKGWRQMYITNDSSCLSGGRWENFRSKVKSWALAQQNAQANVYVKFSDPITKEESPCITDFIVHDNIAPVVSFEDIPASKANSLPAIFRTTANDSLSGLSHLECSLNNENFKICDFQTAYTALSDGAHNFRVQAVDNAGNTSEIDYNWSLDQTLPTVQWTAVAPSFVSAKDSSNFAFTANDFNGIQETKCSLNGSPFTNCASPFKYKNLAEGQHQVSLTAVDTFANTSFHITHQWSVDGTGPNIVFNQAPADHSDQEAAAFQFAVTDALSGVNNFVCALDGAAVNCSGGSAVFDPILAGDHIFTVTATDNVGNASQASHRWNVSKTYNEMQMPVNVPDSYNDVDILFVVDNSRSMRNEQKNMADRLSHFLVHLANLDWQIAVTTTDPSDRVNGDGRIISIHNDNHILDPSYPMDQAQSLLGDAVQFEEEGSNKEQGIRSVYRSLVRSLDNQDPNAYLHRPKAAFSVILISDEDESRNKIENDPYNLIDSVHALWGQDKRFSFHSIITRPGDKDCKKEWEHRYGDTYNLMSELTGGIIGSVCEQDYSSQLSAIGEKVKDDVRTFILPCPPVAKPPNTKPVIEVELENGGQAPDYKVIGNKVIFEEDLPVGDHVLKFSCLVEEE